MSADDSAIQERARELAAKTTFSEQEARVLAYEEHGFSRASIAEELDLSRSTVNEYARRISQRQQKARETLDLLIESNGQPDNEGMQTSLPGFETKSEGRRQLFLCPTANEQAQQHFRSTVLNGVNTDNYRELIPERFDGTVAIWGTGTSAGTKVEQGDVLAFYIGERRYSHIAVVEEAETNKALDKALWTTYEGTLREDETSSWPHIFYLSEPIEVDLASPVLHGDLDYDDEFPLGFRRVANHRVADLYSTHGGLERYFIQAQVRSAALQGNTGQQVLDMHQESSTGPRDTASTETTGDETNPEPSIEELRERAERAGQETAATTQTRTTRRSRSNEVREYALARADGVCEGCRNDAPFVTRRGEPYLEVHHVFQVSDDGADNIDSVVAICPTCHRRVHHAHDGNEYNAELIERLRTDIEARQ